MRRWLQSGGENGSGSVSESRYSMLINGFYASVSDCCGISIFSHHLRRALLPFGINLRETNFRNADATVYSPISLLHYVPSSFINAEASRDLIQILAASKSDENICVILHGVHGREEARFQRDGICPDQEIHLRLLLQKAKIIFALSEAVAEACRTWQTQFGSSARIIRLDHPGLFAATCSREMGHSYAFVGGISRPKKDHRSARIQELIDQCETLGVRIWQHWTNIQRPRPPLTSWMQTSGLLTDVQWSSLISGARAILCPYETRIQSVSGIISEALSAGRFVLATSFDLALEMHRKAPALVRIEDNLQNWPNLLLGLPSCGSIRSPVVPTWEAFAESVSRELYRLSTSGMGPLTMAGETMNVATAIGAVPEQHYAEEPLATRRA
jgi:hypothetical protein